MARRCRGSLRRVKAVAREATREAVRGEIAVNKWVREAMEHYFLFPSFNLLHRPDTLPPDTVFFSSELLDGPRIYAPCMLPRGADGKVLPGFPTPEAERFTLKRFAKSAPQILKRLEAGDVLLADKLTRRTIFKLPGFESYLAALEDEDITNKLDEVCYILNRDVARNYMNQLNTSSEPDDSLCVACLEKEGTVVMTVCGHRVFCPGCRRKAVARVLRVHKRLLNAKELDRTRISCPLCRSESATRKDESKPAP